MEGLGEMLVDPSEQPPHRQSAAPPETLRIQSSAEAAVPRSPQHRVYYRL